jgi:glucose/arabinose dehydrogenase
MQPVTDHNPPDELNHYVEGSFYGHPFVVGNILPRIEYYDRPDIIELAARTTPPEWMFGAHWAVNGFTFLDGAGIPEDHQGDLFAALHGSWNSSKKVGYGIERVLFDDLTGRPYGALRIVTTLTPDGNEVLGRPVDLLVDRDGTILFSCDYRGRVYRIHLPQAEGDSNE